MKRWRPRTCVGCREESPKREILRIVRNADGVVSIDPSGKLPGRGAYVCLNKECVLAAKKKDALSKALKVKVKEEIYEDILRMLLSSREAVEEK